MKYTQLFGKTKLKSYKKKKFSGVDWLELAGFIHTHDNGFYSLLPLGMRVMRKIKDLVGSNLQNLGGVEVSLPIASYQNTLKKSDRLSSVSRHLISLSLNNINEKIIIPPSYEEEFTLLAGSENLSFRDYPLFLYQIQEVFQGHSNLKKKGFVESLEYLRSDSVSFHTSETDMNNFFPKLYHTVESILESCSLPSLKAITPQRSTKAVRGYGFFYPYAPFIPASSSLAICDSCHYKADSSIATSEVDIQTESEKIELPQKIIELKESEKIPTLKEIIEKYCLSENQIAKVYFLEVKGKPYAVFTRYSDSLSFSKLRPVFGDEIYIMSKETILHSNIDVRNFSPYNLPPSVTTIFDKNLLSAKNLYFASLSDRKLYLNNNLEKDFSADIVASVTKIKEGDLCPICKSPLKKQNGIEIAALYKLNDYYTKRLNTSFQDLVGRKKYPYSTSCYISLTRLLLAIATAHHDDCGLIWPKELSPYKIYMMGIGKSKTVHFKISELSKELGEEEILIDDRHESIGTKLIDADSLGIPFRIIVSPKHLPKNSVEISSRSTKESRIIPIDKIKESIEAWEKEI